MATKTTCEAMNHQKKNCLNFNQNKELGFQGRTGMVT